MTAHEPFRRLRFESIPEKPRLAHGYEKTRAREIELHSAHFGRHRVHVRELGDGLPLLLVHGLMTSSYSFRYVFEPLAARFRVIAPDLPGAGKSDKPRIPYTAEGLSTWLLELVDALDIAGCRVIGNSLGGYLCMRAALERPAAFSRLVDVHSPGVPELRLNALHAALALPGMRAALSRWVRRDPERWAHANVHYWDETLKSREEAREYAAAISTREGADAFVSWLGDALRPASMRDFVRELEQRRDDGRGFPIPRLFVYARRDPMVPPRMGERLHALVPDAELVWLDESSHFSHVDSPERLLEAVASFLA